MVARKTSNLEAVGSSPTSGCSFAHLSIATPFFWFCIGAREVGGKLVEIWAILVDSGLFCGCQDFGFWQGIMRGIGRGAGMHSTGARQ